jgi:hypothetical protein
MERGGLGGEGGGTSIRQGREGNGERDGKRVTGGGERE